MCDIYVDMFCYKMEKVKSTTGARLTSLAFKLNTCWYSCTGKVTRCYITRSWLNVLKIGCFFCPHSCVTTDSTQLAPSPFQVTWDCKRTKTFILQYVSGWLSFMESFSPGGLLVHHVISGPLYFTLLLNKSFFFSPAGISEQWLRISPCYKP